MRLTISCMAGRFGRGRFRKPFHLSEWIFTSILETEPLIPTRSLYLFPSQNFFSFTSLKSWGTFRRKEHWSDRLGAPYKLPTWLRRPRIYYTPFTGNLGNCFWVRLLVVLLYSVPTVCVGQQANDGTAGRICLEINSRYHHWYGYMSKWHIWNDMELWWLIGDYRNGRANTQ